MKNCKHSYLVPEAGTSQSGASNLQGVIAVSPTSRSWSYKHQTMKEPIAVSRAQVPLLPRKQGTLHGVQGKTADPGIIAHWSFPTGLSTVSIWLAYYVALSRPRSLSNLLSHGLPDREIIEGGPPEELQGAFKNIFDAKIAKTKKACIKARAEMGRPARPS